MSDAEATLRALEDAIARSRTELRARGRRSPKAPKRARVGFNKFKYAPGAGCGTGAGGFKAGNNCAQSSGFNSPQQPSLSPGAKPPPSRGPVKGFGGKEGSGVSLPIKASTLKVAAGDAKVANIAAKKAARKAARAAAKAAARAARIAAKKAARKAARLAAKKAARLAAKKAARKAERDKQRAEALAKLKEQVAREAFTKGREKRARAKVAPKAQGETTVDYLKRVYAKDLEKLHKRLDDVEAKHRPLVDAATKDYNNAVNALHATPKTDQSAVASATAAKNDALKKLDEAKIAATKAYHDEIRAFTQADGASMLSDLRTQKPIKGSEARESGYSALPQAKKDIIDNARDFYRKMASHRLDRDIEDVRYPDEDPLAAFAVGTYSSDGTIRLRTGASSAGTVVHELGHSIDVSGTTIRDAVYEDYTQRFLAWRSQHPNAGTAPHPQISYYIGPNRGNPIKNSEWDSELGYIRRYCDYTKVEANGIEKRGNEVLTVGLEHMYDQPQFFRSHARQHFDFTLLALAGRFHR